MACRICGDERNVQYYPSKRQALCRSCALDTPRKVARGVFDRLYWRGAGDVAPSIKAEFYSDYLSSNLALGPYIKGFGDEDKANAALIAAAPDHHENALYLDSIMPDTDGLDDGALVEIVITAKAVRDIRAAIAKARRESDA
ncbi:MAG TPA: hypothetical protein VM238_18560 [Phycisphaerae bacterium]|nr:hypothetical protein [Phycisphaerae bacterium]